MLKGNPQFNNLFKQLYVKYNVFHKIPPEIQIVLLISTTSYICINKNKNKHLIHEFLNQPVNEQLKISNYTLYIIWQNMTNSLMT